MHHPMHPLLVLVLALVPEDVQVFFIVTKIPRLRARASASACAGLSLASSISRHNGFAAKGS